MRKYLLPVFTLILPSSPAAAQELISAVPAGDHQITVLASGIPERVDRTGEAVTVISHEEIEALQGPDLTRVLERVPGLTFSRNGGLGAFTGVSIRGAKTEQLLVLIDGVRVADPAAPGAGFDFGNLVPGTISKIEVLRGSNSTIWGNQAVGGILAVTTRFARGLGASAEYGAQDSAYLTLSAGVGNDEAGLALNAATIRSDGVSAAADGQEADGFRQTALGGKIHMTVAPSLTALATVRYADSRLETDGFPAPEYRLADTAEYQNTEQFLGLLGLEYATGRLQLRGTLAVAETERDLYDPALGSSPTFSSSGTSEQAALRGRLEITDHWALDFGGEREATHFRTSSDPRARAVLAGAYSQFDFEGDGAHLAVGLRVDDHSRFGSAWSFGADGVVELYREWRLRASYGEGFKAPTLYQLLSDYGNLSLQPERSHSYDLALEVGDRSAGVHFALTAFRRNSRDLIDFFSCFGTASGICAGRPFGTYDNIGLARAQGIETEAAVRPTPTLRLAAVYTYLEAKNRSASSAEFGNDLARRPSHAATLSADWVTPIALALGMDLRIVSGSFDDAANTLRLVGYEVLTARASVPLTATVELFGRVENVTDDRYQTAAGYGTLGRSAYLGARARF
ncbi:TonB-dependent receptor plug domain-containing protein [Altericroceibacterium xinjiangense]|uniref:TonB-dependent receptor plug domain-containing protein n=1 Tax=Altericroceibacterium xinjiangense TaxID=762261 RepID=UPI000F7F9DC4|nr:TonB-dependent receptor [Altericroceibacterium xinjiangense]